MKKAELLEKINEIYGKVEEAQASAKSLANDLSDIEGMIEDLPDDASEIENDESE